MGIPQLLKFINKNCSNYSEKITLSELSGKKIVIDTSIYLYKYKIKEKLFENFYLLSMLLLENSILPIFVFDGPTHFYKHRTLAKRNRIKKNAEYKLNNITKFKKPIDNKQYNSLRNKTIRITNDDISCVKELLNTLGIMYVDAPYEADEVCAMLVHKKIVYACLSDDTDMFVYGCSKILRSINLFDESVVLYSMSPILRSLRISQSTFREICLLSGTDYNKSYGTIYNNYMRYLTYKSENGNTSFFQWLHDKQIIKGIIFISKLYIKFDIVSANYEELKVFENITLYKKDIFTPKLKLLLRKNYFINP